MEIKPIEKPVFKKIVGSGLREWGVCRSASEAGQKGVERADGVCYATCALNIYLHLMWYKVNFPPLIYISNL